MEMANHDSYEFQSDFDEEESLVIQDDADEISMSVPLAQSTPQNETAATSTTPSSESNHQPPREPPSKGFNDNLEDHTFGIVKKGVYTPCSDFQFDIEAEVICTIPSSSGYVVALTPSKGNETRKCFLTAESTNKKSDFVRCLNASYKSACLQCSFTDKELGEYIQHKKRTTTSIVRKYAVSTVGRQDNETWVFAHNVYLSSSGELIQSEDSQYVWIGDLFAGLGVAKQSEECNIELPLTTDPLRSLMASLRLHFEHNFMPCVLVMASAVIALHYQTFLKKFKSCPVPLAFGESGTGKTTALWCALALIGAQNNYFFSKLSKEKALQLCCTLNIPIGIDDPQSKGDINRLIIDLFNGARNATFAHGSNKPTTTCIIAANFTSSDQQRYASRCLMIEFSLPARSLDLAEYVALGDMWEECSSCVGFCVALGDRFFTSGIEEVDTAILPTMRSAVGDKVTPRVLPSYSILYWFAKELLTEGGMIDLEEELKEHFEKNVLTCATRLQGQTLLNDDTDPHQGISCFSADTFGEELLSCIQGLSAAKIATFLNTSIKYNRQPAYGIVLDSVPELSANAKQQLKAHVSDKSRGVRNNPRFFSTKNLADQGIVPSSNSQCKCLKCTVVVASEFSENIRQQIEAATRPRRSITSPGSLTTSPEEQANIRGKEQLPNPPSNEGKEVSTSPGSSQPSTVTQLPNPPSNEGKEVSTSPGSSQPSTVTQLPNPPSNQGKEISTSPGSSQPSTVTQLPNPPNEGMEVNTSPGSSQPYTATQSPNPGSSQLSSPDEGMEVNTSPGSSQPSSAIQPPNPPNEGMKVSTSPGSSQPSAATQLPNPPNDDPPNKEIEVSHSPGSRLQDPLRQKKIKGRKRRNAATLLEDELSNFYCPSKLRRNKT